MMSQQQLITPLFTATELSVAVLAMAKRIDADWLQYTCLQPQATLTLVVVMNGAWHTGSALSLAMQTPHKVAFIKASSYSGTQQHQAPTLTCWHPPDANSHLLIVEDIVDTGHTLANLQAALLNGNDGVYWKSASLLDKPEARQRQVLLDYVGLTVAPDQFVVGYGLDVDDAFRDLPYIGLYEGS